MKMAETVPDRCSEAVDPVARVSGLLVACTLAQRSIAEINICDDLSACSGGFEIPNESPK